MTKTPAGAEVLSSTARGLRSWWGVRELERPQVSEAFPRSGFRGCTHRPRNQHPIHVAIHLTFGALQSSHPLERYSAGHGAEGQGSWLSRSSAI